MPGVIYCTGVEFRGHSSLPSECAASYTIE